MKINNLLYKKLDLKGIKQAEFEVLVAFRNYCEKHGLRFYLAYGTLIGAVRHKGFIPWDDDIDVEMPIEDYEKLMELVKREPISNNIEFNYFEDGKWPYPFGKLCRTDTITATLDSPYHYGVWVDIFPLDKIAEGDEKTLIKRRRNLRLILGKLYQGYRLWSKKGIVKGLIKCILFPFSIRFLSGKSVKLSKKYRNCPTELYTDIVWSSQMHEIITANELDDIIYLEFEGEKMPTYACYDRILTNIYGNYMELPPEGQRMVHGFDAWIRK